MVLAVVGGVLIIHVLLEVLTNRYKAWRRQRKLLQSAANNVRYQNSNIEEGSDEDTEAEETSRLIFFDDVDRTENSCQQPHGTLKEESFRDTNAQEILRCDYPKASVSSMEGSVDDEKTTAAPKAIGFEPPQSYTTNRGFAPEDTTLLSERGMTSGRNHRSNTAAGNSEVVEGQKVQLVDIDMNQLSTGHFSEAVVTDNPSDTGRHFANGGLGDTWMEEGARKGGTGTEGFLDIDIHAAAT